MTLYELVRQEVTAKQVAELYGLKIDRSGRGYCPWHDDGNHPALSFDRNGWCHCFVCHMNGDATDLAAQMLELPKIEAARRIKADFHLDAPIDGRPSPTARLRMKQRDKKAKFNREWAMLCDVVHEADKLLATYTPGTIDAEFDLILDARCKADQRLNLMWEEIHGRT